MGGNLGADFSGGREIELSGIKGFENIIRGYNAGSIMPNPYKGFLRGCHKDGRFYILCALVAVDDYDKEKADLARFFDSFKIEK
ncbi:MAG: hypothetical protein RDV48_31345 [Candidatus Eremiobacteraeota bacterium]|nr:hypothetical protein [Candidatus Eremiobacteraeota bacterium]